MNQPERRVSAGLRLSALSLAVTLAGCGTIASLFPDKQKQYRYTTEIPSLEIPPDLSSSTIDGARLGGRSASASAVERGTVAEERRAPPEDAAPSTAVSPEAEKPAPERPKPESGPSADPNAPSKPGSGNTIMAEGLDDVPVIEIEEPFDRSWNAVARSLARMKIEVNDQNRSDGTFFVHYGGEEGYTDRGLLGDLSDFLGGGESAQEYRVKLEERGKSTQIHVFDADNRPQSDGKGLDLLKRLHQTLQGLSERRDADK